MDPAGDLAPTLARLPRGTEILVVAERSSVRWEKPGEGVRSILAPPGSSVPQLRCLGLEASNGRFVAFLEDSALPAPGWLEAYDADVEAGAGCRSYAATGTVDHQRSASALDWAVVFAEYAPFLPPGPRRIPPRLAGNNFAASRGFAVQACRNGELHESALLDRAIAAGGDVRFVEKARVTHVRSFTAREAFVDRFRFGLEFGRRRGCGLSPLGRLFGLVAGPAILLAQVIRVAGPVVRGGSYVAPFLRALPLTLALLAAWSLGEWLGWARSLGDRPYGKPREIADRTRERPPVRPGFRSPRCRSARAAASHRGTGRPR